MSQRWWQKCQWEVIGSVYEPPGGRMKLGPTDASGEAARRLMQIWEQIVQGFTTITLRCVLCGDVKTRLEPGNAVVPVTDHNICQVTTEACRD